MSIVCTKCLREKDRDEFYGRMIKTKLGMSISYRKTCKECVNKIASAKVKNKRERDAAYRKAASLWANNDGKPVVPISIIRNLIESPCYYCGNKSDLISVIKRIPKLGFTERNSIPCCPVCLSKKRRGLL
jgi:hypothetical protein